MTLRLGPGPGSFKFGLPHLRGAELLATIEQRLQTMRLTFVQRPRTGIQDTFIEFIDTVINGLQQFDVNNGLIGNGAQILAQFKQLGLQFDHLKPLCAAVPAPLFMKEIACGKVKRRNKTKPWVTLFGLIHRMQQELESHKSAPVAASIELTTPTQALTAIVQTSTRRVQAHKQDWSPEDYTAKVNAIQAAMVPVTEQLRILFQTQPNHLLVAGLCAYFQTSSAKALRRADTIVSAYQRHFEEAKAPERTKKNRRAILKEVVHEHVRDIPLANALAKLFIIDQIDLPRELDQWTFAERKKRYEAAQLLMPLLLSRRTEVDPRLKLLHALQCSIREEENLVYAFVMDTTRLSRSIVGRVLYVSGRGYDASFGKEDGLSLAYQSQTRICRIYLSALSTYGYCAKMIIRQQLIDALRRAQCIQSVSQRAVVNQKVIFSVKERYYLEHGNYPADDELIDLLKRNRAIRSLRKKLIELKNLTPKAAFPTLTQKGNEMQEQLVADYLEDKREYLASRYTAQNIKVDNSLLPSYSLNSTFQEDERTHFTLMNTLVAPDNPEAAQQLKQLQAILKEVIPVQLDDPGVIQAYCVEHSRTEWRELMIFILRVQNDLGYEEIALTLFELELKAKLSDPGVLSRQRITQMYEQCAMKLRHKVLHRLMPFTAD